MNSGGSVWRVAGSAVPDSVWSIGRLNEAVAQALARDPSLATVWVRGEVSNLKNHESGHCYFTLKDSGSQVSCTFFRTAVLRHRGQPLTEGADVLARGRPGIFSKRGTYQFNVQEVRPAGLGELRQQLDELKRRLYQEGLFASERKRPLPLVPFTLGVVTAPGGAAIQDIVRVARGRFPDLNILLAPCLVQGPDAVRSIAAGIQLLNDPTLNVDVIIAGRGGGSFEDLLPFSDERVVRAFAASRLPIVSAVGHEIDTPLCDYAADAAAATPSAAAERAVPVIADVVGALDEAALRLNVALHNRRRYEAARLRSMLGSEVYRNPASLLEPRFQAVDVLSRELRGYLQGRLHGARRQLEPSAVLQLRFSAILARLRGRFEVLTERLQHLSVQSALERGYAIVRDADGKIVRAASGVQPGDRLEVILGQGRLEVETLKTVGQGSQGPMHRRR